MIRWPLAYTIISTAFMFFTNISMAATAGTFTCTNFAQEELEVELTDTVPQVLRIESPKVELRGVPTYTHIKSVGEERWRLKGSEAHYFLLTKQGGELKAYWHISSDPMFSCQP